MPHTCQKIDQGSADDYGPNPHAYIPYMRLADIYLMYAEACAVKAAPPQVRQVLAHLYRCS